VPGTAAPIMLFFSDLIGTRTGKLLPTGNPIDIIEGIEVSCVDAAIPMIIARAEEMGKTGYESPDEINTDAAFFERLERIRVAASHKMGMGDPTGSVVPKFCIISKPRSGGSINARYMVPHKCHATFPLVGSQCLAAAVCAENGDGGSRRQAARNARRSISNTPWYARNSHSIRVRAKRRHQGHWIRADRAQTYAGRGLHPASTWPGSSK
jgi:2-methylaconitate cis-trans-isomerase PrpF